MIILTWTISKPFFFQSIFQVDPEKSEPQRAVWDNQLEFLMSCIATSVGLGNVWRFPFIAYLNGGGAFLIPYIIVLLLIGKPMYYLECALGQFSSRNSVSVWSLSPAMKGELVFKVINLIWIKRILSTYTKSSFTVDRFINVRKISSFM